MASRQEKKYLPRLIEPKLERLVNEFPAVMIRGPRAVGKTTTAARYSSSIVSLEQSAQAAIFRADPDAALRGFEEPILIDEWQEVPEVLGAIRRAVDNDFRPGRFIITGSANVDPGIRQWPGTGRILDLSLFPMTVRESEGTQAVSFFDTHNEWGDTGNLELDVMDYLHIAFASGFPAARLMLEGQTRHDWIEAYVDRLVTRDVEQLDLGRRRRDSNRLKQYLSACALNSAGLADHSTIYRAANVAKETGRVYEEILQDLYVLDLMPSWETNRLKRLTLRSKRYLIDAALIPAALKLSIDDVVRDGDLLGRMLDTFVAAQLRTEAACSTRRVRLHHLRTQEGRQEIDMVAELDGGSVIAIEIKATAAPSAARDAKHLVWLRDQLGDRFEAGYLFHTGPRAFELGNRIRALPIAALWAQEGSREVTEAEDNR